MEFFFPKLEKNSSILYPIYLHSLVDMGVEWFWWYILVCHYYIIQSCGEYIFRVEMIIELWRGEYGGKKLKNVVLFIYITIDVETSEKTKHKTKIRFFLNDMIKNMARNKKERMHCQQCKKEWERVSTQGSRARELSDPNKISSSIVPKIW